MGHSSEHIGLDCPKWRFADGGTARRVPLSSQQPQDHTNCGRCLVPRTLPAHLSEIEAAELALSQLHEAPRQPTCQLSSDLAAGRPALPSWQKTEAYDLCLDLSKNAGHDR